MTTSTKNTTPAAVTEKAGMAEYIVYAIGGGGSAYPPETRVLAEVGRVTAKSAADAVRAKQNGPGSYVAVAVKYVKPLTVTVETVEKVNVG